MGIPSYFSYIIKKYEKTIMKTPTHGYFQSLFMDCNSIIYDGLHNIEYNENHDEYERQIIAFVIAKIEDYIHLIKPSNTIFLAFDGVAPFAKMKQQKQRRYKSDFLSNHSGNKSKWSSCNITPGTAFMALLSKELEMYFNDASKYSVRELIVSSSNENGEGEHKLFHHIKKNDYNSDTVALYGLDADLIMLSIFHIQNTLNIYTFRETPDYQREDFDSDFLFLDIRYLCDRILDEISPEHEKERLYDYIFLCFLLGNDFMPHFPALNIRTHGIDTLLQIYANVLGNKHGKYFIKDGKIVWYHFYLFIKELSKSEHEFLTQEYEIRNRHKYKSWVNCDEETFLNNVPIIYRKEETYIMPNEHGWQKRYYFALFDTDINENALFIKYVCVNYLEGLEWVFHYYNGHCINWKWCYKYDYPPLLNDLVKYIPNFDKTFVKNDQEAYCSNFQLLYVVPGGQYDILPQQLREFINTKNVDFFQQYEFGWAFCRYFWESHVKLPITDEELLIKRNADLLRI